MSAKYSWRRWAQLLLGLALFGGSLGLMVRANLGLGPWDVLHQGLGRRTGFAIGWVVIALSAIVLLGWLPLRQRPGPGTVLNALLVGLWVNATLVVLPPASTALGQFVFLGGGILINGIATGLYIGAGLGPGPRDGLMVGIARLGYPIWAVRTGIEGSVLVVGFMLGGQVGIGTLLYALAIGPLSHVTIPRFSIRSTNTDHPRSSAHATAARPVSS